MLSRRTLCFTVALMASLTKGCNVLIGDGILEFQPARMAMYDSSGRNDMGAVEYRGDARGSVYVLPARGGIFELLPFEFETPDRIHLIGVTCTLTRTTAAIPTGAASTGAVSAGRATPATPPPASRAGGAKPAAVPAPAAPPASPRSGLLMIRDRIGYQCAEGVQLAVERCFDESPEADCQVIRVDQPPRNGLEVTFIDTRGALTKRVASCMQRSLVLEKGLLKLVP